MLPENHKPKSTDIYAAQKIIADISSGLYRSPAAALKELVSNAYDANAENVIIETDAPNFRTLVVSDDGSGMTVEKFLEVMNHIGGSRKRIIGGNTTEGKGRKIIGRIGIGMLAVAQLGYRFYVASSVSGESTRFIAEVNLEPFHKDDAALMSMGLMKEDQDEVHIGAVSYVDDIPEEKDSHYTVITIPNAKKGLISEVGNEVRAAVGATEKLAIKKGRIKSFQELIDVTRSSRRADTDLDGYYYMLWELAQLCPINYVNDGPFDQNARPIEGLDKLSLPSVEDFRVVVDGVELFRPQLFPNLDAISYSSPNPKVYPFEFDRRVAGRALKFTGYIYAQQPRIDPEELRGVAIRISDVGIGRYDRTWLGYPFNEGQKFGQVTGEIFVEDGLESALNIDRDSFRETDVHYQALRAFVWTRLRELVFPDFKVRQKTYSQKVRSQHRQTQEANFTERLLQLPAPLITEELLTISKVEKPNISSWIEASDNSMRFDKVKWTAFQYDTELMSEDARLRFVRVLKALVSNEFLINMPEEEIEPLLKALALAVQ